MRRILIALLLASALVPAGSAHGDTPSAPTVAAFAYTFLPAQESALVTISIPRGTALRFANDELSANYVPHNLYSVDPYLFGTGDSVWPGQNVAVAGVEALGAGRYRFHCTVHVWMQGLLIVT